MWGKTLRCNIHVIEVPRGEERKNGAETVLEDVTATDGWKTPIHKSKKLYQEFQYISSIKDGGIYPQL